MPKDRPEPRFAFEVEDLARRLDGEFLDLERAQDPGQRAARVAGALKTAHTLKGSAAVVRPRAFPSCTIAWSRCTVT